MNEYQMEKLLLKAIGGVKDQWVEQAADYEVERRITPFPIHKKYVVVAANIFLCVICAVAFSLTKLGNTVPHNIGPIKTDTPEPIVEMEETEKPGDDVITHSPEATKEPDNTIIGTEEPDDNLKTQNPETVTTEYPENTPNVLEPSEQPQSQNPTQTSAPTNRPLITVSPTISPTNITNTPQPTVEPIIPSSTPDSGIQPEPPALRDFEYDTVDELLYGIANDFTEDKLSEIESLEDSSSKGSFRKFINNRKAENSIYVPYYNGQIMKLRDEEGYYNTILVPVSLGKQPTIGFYTKHNGNVITIFTTYLDTLASKETISMADKHGPEWLFSQLNPEIKIPELITDYKEHYEKEIQMKNRTVKVIYVEHEDTSRGRIYVTFAYDDILVRVFGKREAVEDWLKGADFKPVALK